MARAPALLDVIAGLVVFATACPPESRAQPYSPLAVPDSSLVAAIRANRANFENHWNALLVSSLRATLASADSASRLNRLARRVAEAEPVALGSRIAHDALAREGRLSTAQRRLRITAAVRESLGAVARAEENWGRAEQLYRESLGLYRRLGEIRREAWVLGSLGVVALSAGNYEQALHVYAEALAARRALGDPQLLGNTLGDLGQVMFRLERYPEAYGYLCESAEVRETSGQLSALGGVLGFLASTLVALGARDSAELCVRRSLELTSSAGDSARTLTTLINYGAMLMDRGDPVRAVAIYDRARRITSEIGGGDGLAVIEENLGDLCRQTGRYSESIEHFHAALALRREDPAGQAGLLNGLGRCFMFMGDSERARPPLERALTLADSLGLTPVQARTLVNLSAVAMIAGHTTIALRLGERAIERAMAARDSTLVRDAAINLGQIALDTGSPARAGKWLDRALAALPDLHPEAKAALLGNRGLGWHREGNLDRAVEVYREALALAEQAGAGDVATRIITNLGDVAERRGDYTQAFARYGDALARIDAMRRRQRSDQDAISTLASRRYVFEAVIHLLSKLDANAPDSGYSARAFEWAETSRARAFLDLALAARAGRARAGRTAPAGAARTDMVRAVVADLAPAARDTGQSTTTVTLAETQRFLRSDDEALLEYSVGDSSTTLWVIRRAGWKHFILPRRAALRGRVQSLRQHLGDPVAADGPAARSSSRALYRMLFEPAEPELRLIKRLVIVADDLLALIPFEALLARDPGTGVPSRGSYVGERFAISYSPSAAALGLRGHSLVSNQIVALGDPRFSTDGSRAASENLTSPMQALAELPSSRGEIDALERLGGSRPVVALRGSDASAERLLALPGLSSALVLHLATHGDVNEAEPARSGLWLAANEGSDRPSRLDVADIMQLRLAAGLVTLSACETGVGRLERGEGVLGLQRAFLLAGARSVVVSLWRVQDRSTAELMSRFYRPLLRNGADKRGALARARREMLRRPATRSPFFWAPFILVGDAGSLEN